jgi:DNA primase
MQDSAKYLIHADIRASGVVERSDVVGAIFGQTEGLLGDDLDLRDLQESSKVGRIDVEIDSEAGRSYGTVTIASGLDRVETAVLAAALETIDRIGPCRAEFEIHELEDVRAAKRREVVDRATDLLAEFEEATLSSRELVEEVRQNVRVADITGFEGLPAGPRVAESDAIVVVEGRADVLQLLKYGVKNAIAVEGTDVPEAVAELTRERTVTAFLDGDRGGDLILEELAQVGSVDYVAFAPAGRSVEDLSRDAVLSALREKVLYEEVADATSPRAAVVGDGTDDASRHPDADGAPGEVVDADGGTVAHGAASDPEQPAEGPEPTPDEPDPRTADPEPTSATREDTEDSGATPDSADALPQTLAGHAEDVAGTGTVRLLDDTLGILAEAAAEDAFDIVEAAETVPDAVVLDGALTQRVLDVAAQRGVRQIVATREGEFVKRPTSVRVRTADGF